MPVSRRQNLIEWSFIAALVLICAVLTWLQYRWTGALARAEMATAQASLGQQSALLTRAFDDELTRAVTALLPSSGEIERHGRDAAHLGQLNRWLATKPRPIFKHMAVASRVDGSVQLFALQPEAKALPPMEWPAGWSGLREHLSRKGRLGPPENRGRPGSPPEPPGGLAGAAAALADPTTTAAVLVPVVRADQAARAAARRISTMGMEC